MGSGGPQRSPVGPGRAELPNVFRCFLSCESCIWCAYYTKSCILVRNKVQNNRKSFFWNAISGHSRPNSSLLYTTRQLQTSCISAATGRHCQTPCCETAEDASPSLCLDRPLYVHWVQMNLLTYLLTNSNTDHGPEFKTRWCNELTSRRHFGSIGRLCVQFKVVVFTGVNICNCGKASLLCTKLLEQDCKWCAAVWLSYRRRKDQKWCPI